MEYIIIGILALIITVLLFATTGKEFDKSEIPYAILTFVIIYGIFTSLKCMIPVR